MLGSARLATNDVFLTMQEKLRSYVLWELVRVKSHKSMILAIEIVLVTWCWWSLAWCCCCLLVLLRCPLLSAHNRVHWHRHVQMPTCSKPHQYTQLCNGILTTICTWTALLKAYNVKRRSHVVQWTLQRFAVYPLVYPSNRFDVWVEISLRRWDLKDGIKNDV